MQPEFILLCILEEEYIIKQQHNSVCVCVKSIFKSLKLYFHSLKIIIALSQSQPAVGIYLVVVG